MSDGLVCIFQKLLIFKDFPTQPPLDQEHGPNKRRYPVSSTLISGQQCFVDARDQRRVDRLLQADRKATATQITTCYTVCRKPSLNAKHRPWSRYSSRELHCVPNTVVSFCLKLTKMKVKKILMDTNDTPQPPRRYTSGITVLLLLLSWVIAFRWFSESWLLTLRLKSPRFKNSSQILVFALTRFSEKLTSDFWPWDQG